MFVVSLFLCNVIHEKIMRDENGSVPERSWRLNTRRWQCPADSCTPGQVPGPRSASSWQVLAACLVTWFEVSSSERLMCSHVGLSPPKLSTALNILITRKPTWSGAAQALMLLYKHCACQRLRFSLLGTDAVRLVCMSVYAEIK